jgi:hypothetical protein
MRAQLITNAKRLTSAAMIVLCLATTSVARADDTALYTKTLRGTGWIYVPGGGDGTCWVIDREQRLVITNKHVVGTGVDAEVMFPTYQDGKLLTAAGDYLRLQDKLIVNGKVLARDAKRDLALVQLERLPEGISALPLADASARLDEMLLSIGNSGLAGKPIEQGTLWKMRTGRVVHKSFRVVLYNNVNQKLETSLLNSDLKTSAGDSGGPVVNGKGELVGVTSGGNGQDSFAVDITEVREFMTQAMTRGRRPASSGHIVTGTWTQSWNNTGGQREFAGLTLRPDGTALFEDRTGAHEGTYNVADGRLTLILPGLARQSICEVTWTGPDSFRMFQDGTEYTIVRR